MTDIAEAISREMKFIIKWVERRVEKVIPRQRPGTHDKGAMLLMIFPGGDQIQYVSNCHRDDAADMMQELLQRWGKEGPVHSDISFHAKAENVPIEQLHEALKTEILNLFADLAIRGHPIEAILLLLQEVTESVIRSSAKPGRRAFVADEIARHVSNTLLREDREYKAQQFKTGEAP